MLFEIAFNTIQTKKKQLETSQHREYLMGFWNVSSHHTNVPTSLYNKPGLKLNSILSPNCNIDCMIQNIPKGLFLAAC